MKLQEHISSGVFETAGSICRIDNTIHTATDMLVQDFTHTRKYASHRRDLEKGSEETFTRRVYFDLYFSDTRRVEETAAWIRTCWILNRSSKMALPSRICQTKHRKRSRSTSKYGTMVQRSQPSSERIRYKRRSSIIAILCYRV